MKMRLSCRCGQLQGELDSQAVTTRATCYCKDCQAYARFLAAEPDFLDDAGGTDVIVSLPAGLRFTEGHQYLACMSLSPKGIYRWYAACCRTPIGNTPRDATIAYVGIVRAALADPGAVVDAAGGTPGIVLNTGSARRPVASTPIKFAWGGARIARMIIGARLRKRYLNNPFFEQSDGRPVKPAQVLSASERAALG